MGLLLVSALMHEQGSLFPGTPTENSGWRGGSRRRTDVADLRLARVPIQSGQCLVDVELHLRDAGAITAYVTVAEEAPIDPLYPRPESSSKPALNLGVKRGTVVRTLCQK